MADNYDLSRIKITAVSKPVEKLFTKKEFSALLHRATTSCIRFALEQYCEGPIPERVMFFKGWEYKHQEVDGSFSIPSNVLFDLKGIVPHLLREDGFHLADIHLAPFGVTNDATIIQVTCGIAPGDGWTNRISTHKAPWDFGAFIVTGPSTTSEQIKSKTRVRLPRVTVKRGNGK